MQYAGCLRRLQSALRNVSAEEKPGTTTGVPDTYQGRKERAPATTNGEIVFRAYARGEIITNSYFWFLDADAEKYNS